MAFKSIGQRMGFVSIADAEMKAEASGLRKGMKKGLEKGIEKGREEEQANSEKKNEAFRQTHRQKDRFVRKGASRTEAVAEKTFFYNMTFTHKIEGFQNLRFPCGNLFFIHVFNINRGRHTCECSNLQSLISVNFSLEK